MVFLNYSTMQMVAKIVYYGPGLCGKTTNLKEIYRKTSAKSRGEMVSLETETDRTLFFDLLPMDVGVVGGFKTKFQLYTVPGQVFYNSTRKLVLRGVDGIVFVADSQRPMLEANQDSYENLLENLDEMGLNIEDIPVVFQYNKRDLPNILTVTELNDALNELNRPIVEAAALQGIGVFETLKEISKQTLLKLRSRAVGSDKKKETGPAAAKPAPKPPAKPEPKVVPPLVVAPPPPEPEPEPVRFDSLPGKNDQKLQPAETGLELETGLPTMVEPKVIVLQPGPDGRLKDRRDSTLDNFDLDFPDDELTDDSLDLDELGGLEESDALDLAKTKKAKEEDDADPFGFGKDDEDEDDFGLDALTHGSPVPESSKPPEPVKPPELVKLEPLKAPEPEPKNAMVFDELDTSSLDPDDPFLDEELLERLTAPDPPKPAPAPAPSVAAPLAAAPILAPQPTAKTAVEPKAVKAALDAVKPVPVSSEPPMVPAEKMESKSLPVAPASAATAPIAKELKPSKSVEPVSVVEPVKPAPQPVVAPTPKPVQKKHDIGNEPTIKQDLVEPYPNPAKKRDLTTSLKELDALSSQVRQKPTKSMSQKNQLDALLSDIADSKKAKLEKISFKVPEKFSSAQLSLVLVDKNDNVIHTHLAKVDAVEVEPGRFQIKLQYDIEAES